MIVKINNYKYNAKYWCAICFNNMLYKTALNLMNLKRIFGAILTILGIIGLIYTGYGVINRNGDTTTLVVVGIISILFFFTGVSLVRTTKDEAE
jgi:uncharacterized membrane protein